jgi:anti-sigma regulatory factor (Ser/Thr protein kinase)
MGSAAEEPTGWIVDLSSWAESAFDRLEALPGVRRVGLAIVEGGGRQLLFTASDRRSADLGWCHVDFFDEVPLNDAIGSGTKMVGSLDDLDQRYASFIAAQHDAGFVAVAAVPFRAADRVVGGFVLYYDHVQGFDREQRDELDDVADGLAGRLYEVQRRPAPTIPSYQAPRGSRTASREFPAQPESVPEARHFLGTTLADWDVEEDTRVTAVLCLSELVTNAIIHAHSGCCVQVELHQQVLRVEVHDAGPGASLPPPRPSHGDQPSGRGLQIVEATSDRWGQILGPDRAVVWFALDLAPGADRDGSAR